RFVNQTFIENVFAKPVDVMTPNRTLQVRTFVDDSQKSNALFKLTEELRDNGRILASESKDLVSPADHYDLTLSNLGAIELWGIDRPKLYDVSVKLTTGGRLDAHSDPRC